MWSNSMLESWALVLIPSWPDIYASDNAQGFFSKFLMRGLKIFRPPLLPNGDEVGWGEGLAKKIWLKPKLPTYKCKIRPFFAILSMKYIKSSQIWHKNVFKFFKFSGTNLGWGGQALVQKRGQVSDGGIDKIFAGWGTPQEKNHDAYTCQDQLHIQIHLTGYVGLILRSTPVATESYSILEDTMRVLWHYCVKRLRGYCACSNCQTTPETLFIPDKSGRFTFPAVFWRSHPMRNNTAFSGGVV